MYFISKLGRLGLSLFTAVAVVATSFVTPATVQAQELRLEEVVVTAQRREQTLQDVPISVGVYSGEDLELQGFKDLDALSRFSASISVRDGTQSQDITIRGFGTAGNSLTLQQAAPLFVDGIHYGSQSMIKNAFLDTERVEVLKGPQPLHFGMNATAGAFNIISRRPTPEWEGEIATELGNFGRREVTAAFGGPLTDTLGIRVAGIYEKSDGPLKNRVDGGRFPRAENLGGRVMLEWTPNNNFTALTKFEISRQRNGADAITGCLTSGFVTGFGRDVPLEGSDDRTIGLLGNGRSVWASPSDPQAGVEFGERSGLVLAEEATGEDCFNQEYGFSREGPDIAPPISVHEEAAREMPREAIDPVTMETVLFSGDALDHRALAQRYYSTAPAEGPGAGGTQNHGVDGKNFIDSYNALLDMTYTLDNGIDVNSQTGFVRFNRNAVWDNCNCPFLFNPFGRETDMYQWSQQVRVESPAEGFDLNMGGANLQFMFGAFWQESNKDMYSNALRPNVRRGQRLNKLWEDARWGAAFWNLTFNFMDRQLSFDIGGRYTDVHKDVFIRGFGASFIFDEIPCDSDQLDTNPDSCDIDPDFKRVDPSLSSWAHIDPITGNGALGTDGDADELVRIDSPRILLDNVDMDNLWTTSYWGATTAVPRNYAGGGEVPVGLTAPVFSNRNGPFGPCDGCVQDVNQDADHYDQQYVIRYTPNALQGNHTFYGKYVTAFKGPVTDTGQATIPTPLSNLTFLPEFSTGWELGAKGTALDGRIRYDVAAFINKFRDLQTFAAAPQFNPQEQQQVSLNAGKQEVRGLEFSITALATQNLTLNLAGAFMDGEMKDFDGGGCTESEIAAASWRAVSNPGDFNADELDFAQEIIDNLGPARVALLPPDDQLPKELFHNGGCRLETTIRADGTEAGRETIDRSGEGSRFTPDWKFVAGANYTQPVFDNYEAFLNVKGFIMDEMLVRQNFDRSIMHNSGSADMNLSGGISASDGTWRLMGYVRSIFEDTLAYNPEYNLELRGLVTEGDGSPSGISTSAFRSYGVRFEYNFQ